MHHLKRIAPRGPRSAGPLLALLVIAWGPTLAAADLDVAAAGRFADLALHCVHLEYPNKLSHTLQGDADARPPRALTPAFYGCYDWHSSVHGHWLLARLARLYPDAPFAEAARAALDRSLGDANLAGELRYFQTPGRASFERPYGLAWLLQLAAELRAWDDPQAKRTICVRFCAAPHSMEATVKPTTAHMNTRLRPRRAVRNPVSGMKMAAATM